MALLSPLGKEARDVCPSPSPSAPLAFRVSPSWSGFLHGKEGFMDPQKCSLISKIK